MRRDTRLFIRQLVLMLLASIFTWGQVNKSNLTGVVRLPSGGAIVGAPVRLTNTGTGASSSGDMTDTTGLYRFTLLDHGFYRVEIEQPGFRRFCGRTCSFKRARPSPLILRSHLVRFRMPLR